MSPAPPADRLWNRARLGAAAAFVLCAFLLGFRSPGLSRDEAVGLTGAVRMLTPGQASFAHDPASGFTFAGRWWPLMATPDRGPLRGYLSLLPFAAYGANYSTVRLLAALLGAFGIWGFSILTRDLFGPRTAVAVSWILAVHPACLALTLYRGGVGEWMVSFGLLSIALAQYLKDPGERTALWLGVAAGFGVWTRVDFVWLPASAAAAGALALGKRILIPRRHAAVLAAGALLGAAPLLWYQIRSGWATLDSFRSMPAPEPWLRRLNLLSQTLLSDPGTRSAWDGPALPAWQWILYPTLVVIALGANLRRGGAARMAGLIFALLALYLLFSPLKIEDRHFVELVPLAALLVTLAARDLRRRRPAAWIAAALAAVIYLGSAVDWNLAAARQLRATGGVGLWSNAIDKVAAYLQRNSRGRKVKVLDWGLNDSLLVLTGGQVDSAEIFQGATAGHSGTGRPWKEEIVPGGVYVLHSPETVVFPEAGDAFRRVLAEMQLPFRRTQFRQKAKGWYAEVVEVLPPP